MWLPESIITEEGCTACCSFATLNSYKEKNKIQDIAFTFIEIYIFISIDLHMKCWIFYIGCENHIKLICFSCHERLLVIY